MSNKGEEGEIIVKARILCCMLDGKPAGPLGNIDKAHLGDFKSNEGTYLYPVRESYDEAFAVCDKRSTYTYNQMSKLLKRTGIRKASSNLKADLSINGKNYSLKSASKRPAIINHTKRTGFLTAYRYSNAVIEDLDTEVTKYWTRRLRGVLAEDINGDSRKAYDIFWSSSFKESFRPIFNYFAFQGTGRGISKQPADSVLEFVDPKLPETWKTYSRDDFYDVCWPKLVFSLRNHNQGKLSSDDFTWAKNCDGKLRAQLHIRVA